MNHLPVQYLIGGTEKLSDAVWTLNAKTDAEDETLWLPLVVHLQDTAAVMSICCGIGFLMIIMTNWS